MGSNASDENIWASTRVHNANREETNTEASLLNTPLAVPRPLMGWSGRAPAPPAREAGKGRQDKEHAMPSKLNIAIASVIGIDIGKNSFHVVGQDQRGTIVLRQKWSRGQVEARLANLPPCLIGMEACVGAHHL